MDIDWMKWRGAPIEDEERTKWAQRLIEKLDGSNQTGPWYISSGDSIVIVSRGSFGGFEIRDCKVRRVANTSYDMTKFGFFKRSPDKKK